MKPISCTPATLSLSAQGEAIASPLGVVLDVSDHALQRAQHRFIVGTHTQPRWAGRTRWTVLEAGFGFGLNFLPTWQAWREDRARPQQLHYVAIEPHPFRIDDLVRLHAYFSTLHALSARLRGVWPMQVSGTHRLHVDDQRVTLTLVFANAPSAAPELRVQADAVYLNGHAPEKDPQMWTPNVLRRFVHLCTPEAWLASHCVDPSVVAALRAAGCAVEQQNGHRHTESRLQAQRIASRSPQPVMLAPPPQRSVAIVGAGLAGAAVSARLAARGWKVTLIDQQAALAQGASGNLAGIFHPIVTRDDSVVARLTRAAFLYGVQLWSQLPQVRWSACGVLQMARHADEARAQRAAIAECHFPENYVRFVQPNERPTPHSAPSHVAGLWFAQAGWLCPTSLTYALTRHPNIQTRLHGTVASMCRASDVWRLFDPHGALIVEAPHVVLANAADIHRLLPNPGFTLQHSRGQVSYVPAHTLPQTNHVLLRGTMLLPAIDGQCMLGATYDLNDLDTTTRAESHAENLSNLTRLLPTHITALDPTTLSGRAGVRCVSVDRLPLLGGAIDRARMHAEAQQVIQSGIVPRIPGLHIATGYASRGIVWNGLLAELLASELEAEPLPLEASLVRALDPARFALRALRQQTQ